MARVRRVKAKVERDTHCAVAKMIKPKAAIDMEALEAFPTIEQLRAMAKKITAKVRARLGDRITPESLARGFLFEAAWASVECEKRLLALKYADAVIEDQHRDLLRAVELGKASEDATEVFHSCAMPLARRGARFSGNKRGMSPLYRAALEILKLRGPDTPVKKVYKELETNGKIIDGKPSLKAFSTQLSRHQKTIR